MYKEAWAVMLCAFSRLIPAWGKTLPYLGIAALIVLVIGACIVGVSYAIILNPWLGAFLFFFFIANLFMLVFLATECYTERERNRGWRR